MDRKHQTFFTELHKNDSVVRKDNLHHYGEVQGDVL